MMLRIFCLKISLTAGYNRILNFLSSLIRSLLFIRNLLESFASFASFIENVNGHFSLSTAFTVFCHVFTTTVWVCTVCYMVKQSFLPYMLLRWDKLPKSMQWWRRDRRKTMTLSKNRQNKNQSQDHRWHHFKKKSFLV